MFKNIHNDNTLSVVLWVEGSIIVRAQQTNLQCACTRSGQPCSDSEELCVGLNCELVHATQQLQNKITITRTDTSNRCDFRTLLCVPTLNPTPANSLGRCHTPETRVNCMSKCMFLMRTDVSHIIKHNITDL